MSSNSYNRKFKRVNTSITITAAMGALIIVMGLTHIGFIPWFSGASITIMQVPVIIAAILAGKYSGFGTGLIFGLFSLLQAAIAPIGPLDPFFVNPLVSILPRVLMGIGTYCCYKVFNKFNNFPKSLNYGISGFLGSLINTCLVLLMLVSIKAIDLKMALAVLISNGILEAVASAIITSIVISLIKFPKRKSKFSEDEKSETLDTDKDINSK